MGLFEGNWIIRIYLALLARFPRKYREEFGEELEYAIRMAVEAARARGRWRLVRLAWREMRDLAIAILRTHLDARRGRFMKPNPGSHLPGEPLHGWQIAAVFVPFLFTLAMAAAGLVVLRVNSAVSLGVLYLLGGLWVVVVGAGLVKEFPTWALPSSGVT